MAYDIATIAATRAPVTMLAEAARWRPALLVRWHCDEGSAPQEGQPCATAAVEGQWWEWGRNRNREADA